MWSTWAVVTKEDSLTNRSLICACLRDVFIRCHPRVLGSLDPLPWNEFIVTHLKGAEHCDWIMSQSSLRRAVMTNGLQMPSLVEVVANIAGVWPLLKETGKRTDVENCYDTILIFISSHCNHAPIVLFQKKAIVGYFCIDQMARTKVYRLHMILEIGKSSFIHWSICLTLVRIYSG